MADSILLFLNGLFWKSVSRDDLIITRLDTPPVRSRDHRGLLPLSATYPEYQGGDVLVPVNQGDERIIGHWLPGVGVQLLTGMIKSTEPIPFDLKVATGTPDNPEYIMEFVRCLVDVHSVEWDVFSHRLRAYDEVTPMWLLFSFDDFWQLGGSNCCEEVP